MSFDAFEQQIARLNDVLCAVNLLTRDSRTMMPPGGLDARSKQIATLVGMTRDMATGEGLQRAIEDARAELAGNEPHDARLHAVEQAAAATAVLARIPASLVSASAELKTVAKGAWSRARGRLRVHRFRRPPALSDLH
jgi:carboxypeptidase Taq